MADAGLSRSEALETIKAWGEAEWTVAGLAERMGVKERAARAVVAWLVIARVVEKCGSVMRPTTGDKRYRASTYRWSGRGAAPTLARDGAGGLRAVAEPTGRDARFAAYWLSRPWR